MALPYSDEFCRGVVRSLPSGSGILFCAGVLIITGGAFDVEQGMGISAATIANVVRVSLAGILVFGLLSLAVVLFNWPKMLAVPYLRAGEGSFVAHRRARLRRKSS